MVLNISNWRQKRNVLLRSSCQQGNRANPQSYAFPLELGFSFSPLQMCFGMRVCVWGEGGRQWAVKSVDMCPIFYVYMH